MKQRVSTILCISCLSLGLAGHAWSKPPSIDKFPRGPSANNTLPDMPLPIPDKLTTSAISGTFTGEFASLETDAKGTITQLAIRSGSTRKIVAFDGCGAKARDLPQLMWAHHHVDTDNLRISLALTVKTKGRCIDRIGVRRVYKYRYDIMLNAIFERLKSMMSILKDIRRQR